MGKSRTRKQLINKKKFIIIECCLIGVLFISIIVNCFMYIKLSGLENNYIKLEEKKNKMMKESYNVDKDLVNIRKTVEDYQNIDKVITEKRNEYYMGIKKLEDLILEGKSDKKIAYLTFDDGPYYNTYKVLDILDQYNVKATFFTISMNGQYCFDNKGVNCQDVYKEYVKRGHTIANHTYTHGIKTGLYNSVDSFMDAIIRQEELIKEKAGGYTTRIMRFPGGSSQAKDLKGPITDRLRERGYGWVDWTALDGDGKALASREQAWNNLVSSLNDNIEVILFHDYNRITTEILPDAITYMRDNGYQLYPLFYESVMIQK